MPEPREEDNIAIDKNNECDDCGNFIHTCKCSSEDPDRMHDEMYED